ncbi:MAG: DsbC family protein [Betaproteobacteria bacterium]|nr:DsbC family protein [Betaproteobacteria bacterium]
MFKKHLPVLALSIIAGAVQADETELKKAMEARLGTKVESIVKSGYLGLYEVYTEGNILYTDEKMTAFIAGGQLIDGKTLRNVTEDRLKKLTAIKFSDLPLERAIKQVRGDGKRVIATFEDPNCGYCKRLAKDLQKLDNVTIYTFLYPILSEDSTKKSRQIWCAADRAKAWNDWMVDGRAPGGKEDCDVSAIARNQDFGRRLNITGTPTLFFGDGERVPGAMPLDKLQQKLAQTK